MRHRSPERGSVTAEFAVVIPAVVMVLLIVVGLAMHGAARVALEEGARAAARELARGESTAAAEQLARDAGGPEVSVAISEAGGFTHVELTRSVSILGVIQLDAQIGAEASARTEHLAGLDEQP